MKITEKWLETHKWMIRSSDNGISYCDFKWKGIGKWQDCPDWNTEPECGGGFHGETPEFHGFGIQYNRLELVEYKGNAIPINGDKVKVREARIVAVGVNIPELALTQCGYSIAHDGDTIPPKNNEFWLIFSGHVTISNQTGGYCWCSGNSVNTISNQTGGYCGCYGNSVNTITNQTGGTCWCYGNTVNTISNQTGGTCRCYGNSKRIDK